MMGFGQNFIKFPKPTFHRKTHLEVGFAQKAPKKLTFLRQKELTFGDSKSQIFMAKRPETLQGNNPKSGKVVVINFRMGIAVHLVGGLGCRHRR